MTDTLAMLLTDQLSTYLVVKLCLEHSTFAQTDLLDLAADHLNPFNIPNCSEHRESYTSTSKRFSSSSYPNSFLSRRSRW